MGLFCFCHSQKDYICFDFVPRHHNIIRYRKGIAVIKDDFSTVCSWVQFKNKEAWKYDLFLGRLLKSLAISLLFMFRFIYYGLIFQHFFVILI